MINYFLKFLQLVPINLKSYLKKIVGHKLAYKILNQLVKNNKNSERINSNFIYKSTIYFDVNKIVETFILGNTNYLINNTYKISSKGIIFNHLPLTKEQNSIINAANICEEILPKINQNKNILKFLKTNEKLILKLIDFLPDWPHSYRYLARNLWFQGRINESMKFFTKANYKIKKYRKIFHYYSNNVYLPRNCSELIGLMGHLDSFIKHKILNKDQRNYILIVDKNKIVNKCFLDYFKKYIIIKDISEVSNDELDAEHFLSEDWNWTINFKNKNIYTHNFMAKTQVAWENKRLEPLLKLKKPHKKALKSYLDKIGYKEKDWHVCVHVRSDGFYNESKNTAQSFRNSDIKDYFPLFKKIINNGGWVFRMGDSKMPKIEKKILHKFSGKVIDWAHELNKNEILDISICATCKLFISSLSGLHTVSHAFGRPACYVNSPIWSGFPWHKDEVLLPKKYINKKTNKMLSLEEIYNSKVPYANHGFMLDFLDIRLENNSAEEIIDAVCESFYVHFGKRINYLYKVNKKEKKKVQKVLDKILYYNNKLNLNISGKISYRYVIKYYNQLLKNDG